MVIPKKPHPIVAHLQNFRNNSVARIAWPHSPDRDRFAYWRADVLFSILSTALVLGFFALTAAIALAVKEGALGLALFDVTGFVICLAFILVPRITYEMRAFLVLLMCYATGIAVIISVGPLSGGPAWLFAFAVLTGVLLGTRCALLAIALNAIFLTITAWLISSGKFGTDFPFFKTPEAMVAAGVNFIVVNAIAAISVAALVKRVVSAYDREKALAENLEQEQARLLAAKRSLESEINEREQIENALRESETTYRSFIDKAPMAMYTTNLQGEFTYGNQKLLEITGYKLEDWLNKPFYPIVYPDDLNTVLDKIQKRINGKGTSEPYEIRIFNSSDDLMWVEIISESIFVKNDSGGQALVGMQSFVTDITKKKEAELALRESEEKYRHLFELESDAIFLVDKETGNILEVNESAIDMYGFNREELLRMKNADLSEEPDKTKHATQEQLHQIPIRYHRKKDGSVFPVEITASHLKYKDRDAHIAAIRDISFRVESEKTRVRLEKELYQARKMESIGTLAGGIAHDFNNILYMITGNAELVLEDIPKWNPLHKNIQDIKEAGLRAAGIVKQLLDFSRNTVQELKPIGAITIIENAITFLRSTIPSIIEIRKSLPDEEITISGDPVQINQAMMNICINASQAMEETGGMLEIKVENETVTEDSAIYHSGIAAGEYLSIKISDTGPGIDPKIIDLLFDPYFTTKDVGKGSGMGLAVVRSIVKNHNGAITVDSKTGKGTTFTVLLPVSSEKYVLESQETDEIPRGNETILFVDDEESIVDMAQSMLERFGYRVETRLNPVEALELFKSKPHEIDLIITDMTMPQMTGITLSEKVKNVRSDIPIIICTGHRSLSDGERSKEQGIAGYIPKPIRMKDFVQTIRNVLDRYGRR